MENGIRAAAAIGGAVLLLAGAACDGDGGNAAKPKPAERHLVFVEQKSLATESVWIADVDGDHPRRLTRGFAGVISPDGRTVAISRRGRGIYLISSGGGRVRRLTRRELQPRAWSPDGETLVATVASTTAVVELVAVERSSGRIRVIANGAIYGFDFSPSGDQLVYSRAPEATEQGICSDQFDLYVTDLSGGEPSRLTHDGLSAFPVWGSGGIAFSRFPAGLGFEDCIAPGIWTIDPDGSDEQPILERAPDAITMSGFYGLQPVAWLDDDQLLVGLRTETGNRGAVLDMRTHALSRFAGWADAASSDGAFAAGSGRDEKGAVISITRIGDDHRILTRRNACCPDWNR
jgi:dipeptidyl aminopeptidase/acylaminoacyl peptidase